MKQDVELNLRMQKVKMDAAVFKNKLDVKLRKKERREKKKLIEDKRRKLRLALAKANRTQENAFTRAIKNFYAKSEAMST